MVTTTVGQAVTIWRGNRSEVAQPAMTFMEVWARWEKELLSIGTGSGETSSRVEILQGLLPEIEEGQHQLRTWLLYEVNWLDEESRHRTVSALQTLLVRQLARLNKLCEGKPFDGAHSPLFDRAGSVLETTLAFLEEVFADHFDVQGYVPERILRLRKAELQRKLDVLGLTRLLESQTSSTLNFLIENTERFLLATNDPVLYSRLFFYENLLKELTLFAPSPDEKNVWEILYYLNYNSEEFVELECQRLMSLTASAESSKHKIALLKWDQKRINQILPKGSSTYDARAVGLHQQMNRWIDEEVKYLESGYSQLVADNGYGYNDKIHTSLSVAKLAVIIRLLVVDKIIINRTVAPMLKVVAKVFSTLQKDEVSFGSLESKYHAPDKATVTAVRDMLFKWIRIIDKL